MQLVEFVQSQLVSGLPEIVRGTEHYRYTQLAVTCGIKTTSCRLLLVPMCYLPFLPRRLAVAVILKMCSQLRSGICHSRSDDCSEVKMAVCFTQSWPLLRMAVAHAHVLEATLHMATIRCLRFQHEVRKHVWTGQGAPAVRHHRL